MLSSCNKIGSNRYFSFRPAFVLLLLSSWLLEQVLKLKCLGDPTEKLGHWYSTYDLKAQSTEVCKKQLMWKFLQNFAIFGKCLRQIFHQWNRFWKFHVFTHLKLHSTLAKLKRFYSPIVLLFFSKHSFSHIFLSIASLEFPKLKIPRDNWNCLKILLIPNIRTCSFQSLRCIVLNHFYWQQFWGLNKLCSAKVGQEFFGSNREMYFSCVQFSKTTKIMKNSNVKMALILSRF